MQRQQHQEVLMDLEVKKVAATLVDVPTLPEQVRAALRSMGMPVRLFGENLANVRDRLRNELARRKIMMGETAGLGLKQEEVKDNEDDEEEVTKYTRASIALVEARQAIASFSFQRSRERLETERRRRTLAQQKRKRKAGDDDGDTKMNEEDELTAMDRECTEIYKSLRRVALDGSQYGDTRSLSSICTGTIEDKPVAITSSWNATIAVWDASSSLLNCIGKKALCHEDRIMGSAVQQQKNDELLLATTSIDMTGKLWKVRKSSDIVMEKMDEAEKDAQASVVEQELPYAIEEAGQLIGHKRRLCRVAFHPMKQHVATTSFDHTWRLWDTNTGQNILLQDGHWKECFGIDFHPDGSLCCTTDFSGVVQLWDLRTGKSIKHFFGHAKRVLNAKFLPNGFQLASGGDDGTIKIWDLRRRKQIVSLPAHSNLITNLEVDPGGEFITSSSFDGTVKIWGCRDWKMLNQLSGHDGKVTGVGILSNRSLVSSGFDKTIKLWA